MRRGVRAYVKAFGPMVECDEEQAGAEHDAAMAKAIAESRV